jgi:hypothetical protein
VQRLARVDLQDLAAQAEAAMLAEADALDLPPRDAPAAYEPVHHGHPFRVGGQAHRCEHVTQPVDAERQGTDTGEEQPLPLVARKDGDRREQQGTGELQQRGSRRHAPSRLGFGHLHSMAAAVR